METSNHILKSYQLKSLNHALSENVQFEIHGGGRYLSLGGKWVTADAVSSRIKAIANTLHPQDKKTLELLTKNFIAIDNKGYVDLKNKIENADSFDAFIMKIQRFFKTLFSTSKELRHSELQRLLHRQTPLEQSTSRLFEAFHSHMENQLQLPLHQMKRYYAKVLETSDFELKSLNGYSQGEAILSYLRDLKRFKQIAPSQKLDQVIEELELAFKISSIKYYPQMRSEVKDFIAMEVQQKIRELPPSNALNRPCVLIPGGSENHAIMFKIEKNQNGTYSFTVINTGGGADLNFLRSAWTLLVNERLTVQDIVYTNLTLEHFSKDFILSSILTNKEFQDMEETNQWIEKTLMKGKVQWHYGRKHKAQRKGTCSHKNISSTIHEKLGDKNYNSLKTFITKDEIQNLERLNTQNNQNIKAKMLEEGRKVLKHRSGKL